MSGRKFQSSCQAKRPLLTVFYSVRIRSYSNKSFQIVSNLRSAAFYKFAAKNLRGTLGQEVVQIAD